VQALVRVKNSSPLIISVRFAVLHSSGVHDHLNSLTHVMALSSLARTLGCRGDAYPTSRRWCGEELKNLVRYFSLLFLRQVVKKKSPHWPSPTYQVDEVDMVDLVLK
jgi:hypothetical protein